ncbi:MAG: ATP-binding protein [Flectobacillus sp.]|uniref:sensor histidine kinase n=1 Tax=Flectobacillus sp. TaxID=50419 RepID=UPI003B9DA0C6
MILKEDKLQAQLNFVLNKIPFAVLMESYDRKLQFVNQNFCQLFNIPLSPEQLIGFDCKVAASQSASMFSNPSLFISRIDEILKNEEFVSHELMELADGRVFLRDYLPIINEGVHEGHVWIYYDYTEARTMEYHSMHLKKFYEQILNHIPADIAVWNKKHQYVYINQTAIKDAQLREWLINKDDYDFAQYRGKDTHFADVRRNAFNEAITTQSVYEFLEDGVNREGQLKYNLRRFQPIFKENGELEFVVGYGMDVTSLKKTEEYARQKDITFAKVADLLDVVVIVIDHHYQIVFANAAYESFFGIPTSQIIGKGIDDIAIEDTSIIKKDIELYQQSQFAQHTAKVYQVKDKYGMTKYFSYSFTPYVQGKAGNINYAIFLSDVSDQYYAVSELQKIIDKERRLNELKSGFVNIVSHEMRTPMSVIQSSAEILEMLNEADRVTKPQLELHLSRIINEVKGMESLMQELLLISKIEGGKMEYRPYPQNITELVTNIIATNFEPYQDGRRVELRIKGEEHLVYFDKLMMTHILKNLIENAFKYSVNRQSPVIRLRYHSNGVSILIKDFGIGIPEKDLPNLFKAFARASNVEGIKGTGLGLLVVKYFVDSHKASIQVKSKQNQGTSVLLELNHHDA